ncbi:MAG: hypothetical protein KAG34_05455 [Cocleimonas sp.]|nr:hypothetical protein [Cocleimonas sp.]
MSIKNKQGNKMAQELSGVIFSGSDELRLLDSSYIVGACLLPSITGDIYAAWDASIGIDSLSSSSSYDFPPQFFIKLLPDSFFHLSDVNRIITDEVKHLKECFDWCNIVTFEKNEESAYLVFQFPRGDFFSKKLIANKSYGDLPKVLALLTSIDKTLNILKECGIHHGRVEPDSIYMTESGDIGLVDSIYVAAKQTQLEQEIEHTETVPNKEALYASPDICFGRKISEQDDVFSLSCICYHLLSGQHPFGGVNSVSALLNKIRPEPIAILSEDQWQHLENGLSLSKESRLKTVKEFINGFDLTSKPSSALKIKKKEREATTLARKNAQNLMNNQVKEKVTSKKKSQKIQQRARKPISHQSSFADLHEKDRTSWSWIPISLLSGVLVGTIAMLLSISFFGMDLVSLIEALKNSF